MQLRKRPVFTAIQNKAFAIFEDGSRGMCPAPMDAQLGLNVMAEYLLGSDWYVVDPIHTEQVNTVLVHAILMRYSRKFRWHERWRQKQMKWFFKE